MWNLSRGVITAAVLLLGLGAGACTSEPRDREPTAQASPDRTATHDAPRLRPRAAAYDLSYGRVAGRLGPGRRSRSLRAVTRPVRAWIDAGFVRGPWPRRRFEAAYAPFTPDTAKSARRNARLLTMQALGPTVVDVVPRRRRVRVAATAVGGRPVGATARVDLVFLGLNERGNPLSVYVRGDVYLTATEAKGWQIFGYDLDRWVERGGEATTQGGDR